MIREEYCTMLATMLMFDRSVSSGVEWRWLLITRRLLINGYHTTASMNICLPPVDVC
jgi:hypothetical protein